MPNRDSLGGPSNTSKSNSLLTCVTCSQAVKKSESFKFFFCDLSTNIKFAPGKYEHNFILFFHFLVYF